MDGSRFQEEIEEWIEKTNPSLTLRLAQVEAATDFSLPELQSCNFDRDVLWVQGVHALTEEVLAALDRGLTLIFIEPDLIKIKTWLSHVSFKPHQNMIILQGFLEETLPVIWKHIYRRMEYIGKLPEIESWVASVHMTASDYCDFGVPTVKNIHHNILHAPFFIDGQNLSEALNREKVVVVCGSGDSLLQSIELLQEFRKKIFLIATGSSIITLLKKGVKPDAWAFVDPNPPMEQYRDLPIHDIALLYQNRMSQELFCHHKGSKIWMGKSDGWQIEDRLLLSGKVNPWYFAAGWNAGSFGVAIAYHMGSRKIALAGIDGGIAKDRDLQAGEIEFEGKTSRSDLAYGVCWIRNFAEENSDLRLSENITEELLRNSRGAAFSLDQNSLPKTEIDHASVQKEIGAIWSNEVSTAIDRFFLAVEKTGDRGTFVAESALAQSDIQSAPIYEALLKPLWEVWSHITLRESIEEYPKEVIDFVAELILYRDILKAYSGQTKYYEGSSKGLFLWNKREGWAYQYYPNQLVYKSCYYQNGLEEGECRTYDPKGQLIARVYYREGKVNGEYALFEDGFLKREGHCKAGFLDGVQKVYDREGNILDEAHYVQGKKSLHHTKYRKTGDKEEELTFHNPDRFDKRLFNQEGEVSYEGFWKGEKYIERYYLKNRLKFEREGKLEQGKFCWKEK